MKFLIDAQLPARLARFLSSWGHDALHTLDLPDGNRTTDARIAEVADGSNRVVVTKDRDFRDSHLLTRSPRRLLVVATGNITNDALLALSRSTSMRSSQRWVRATSSSSPRTCWSYTGVVVMNRQGDLWHRPRSLLRDYKEFELPERAEAGYSVTGDLAGVTVRASASTLMSCSSTLAPPDAPGGPRQDHQRMGPGLTSGFTAAAWWLRLGLS